MDARSISSSISILKKIHENSLTLLQLTYSRIIQVELRLKYSSMAYRNEYRCSKRLTTFFDLHYGK